MKLWHRTSVLLLVAGVLLTLVPVAPAASAQRRGRGGGLYGDWRIQFTMGERPVESILSFQRNDEGQYVGQWISFWGVTDLKDLSFADGKLAFTLATRFRGQERTSTFKGTVAQGQLQGTLSGEQGESEITGRRESRPPRAAGVWEMTVQAGERQFTGTLTIRADAEGTLEGAWKSERGEGAVRDLKVEEDRLSFTRTVQRGDNSWDMRFSGTVGRGSLEGTFQSERGEAQVKGVRGGAALIGVWDLTLKSERGERTQRLRIHPDLSALYGSTRIDRIGLEGQTVTFAYTVRFRENEFPVSFSGQLEDRTLTGTLTTSRGTTQVTGTKRAVRRRRPSQG